MPRQRLLLLASWIMTTMLATAVSAAGVSIVTHDVTDDHTPALGRNEVIALLAAPVPTTVPTTPAPTSAVPTTSPAASSTVDTAAPVTSDPPPSQPPPSTASPSTAPPSTNPPGPTLPPLGDAASATYWSQGGSMTVACIGDTIALLSARPNDGYQFVVVDDGPERVHIRFEGHRDDGRGGLAAACRDGAPVEDHDGRGRDRDDDEFDDEDDDDRHDRSGRGDRLEDGASRKDRYDHRSGDGSSGHDD